MGAGGELDSWPYSCWDLEPKLSDFMSSVEVEEGWQEMENVLQPTVASEGRVKCKLAEGRRFPKYGLEERESHGGVWTEPSSFLGSGARPG